LDEALYMKIIITLLLLSSSFYLLAQDWVWFPDNQGIYYKYRPSNSDGFDKIEYIIADSSRTDLQEKTSYLNSKSLVSG